MVYPVAEGSVLVQQPQIKQDFEVDQGVLDILSLGGGEALEILRNPNVRVILNNLGDRQIVQLNNQGEIVLSPL